MSESVRRATVLATLLVATLGAAQVAGAAELGSAGEIYTLRTGTYDELFPSIVTTAGETPIVALDVVVDGQLTRQVVPGSEGVEVEDQPQTVFDDASSVLYLLWRQTSTAGSTLQLQSFREGDFTALSEVSLAGFDLLGAPSLTVTRSRFEGGEAEGPPLALQRTVLHLVTVELVGAEEQIVYRPIVLVNGVLIGSAPPFVVNTLLSSSGTPPPGGLPEAFFRQVWTATGVEEESVVVVFADRPSSTLAAVQLRPLPGEIGLYADRARSVIIGSGRKLLSGPGFWSEEVYADVLALGVGFHPGIAQHLAEAARDDAAATVAAGGDPLAMAERARSVIIGSGLRSRVGGVLGPDLEQVGVAVLQLPLSEELEWAGTPLVEMRTVGEWSLDGVTSWPAGVVPSANGAEVLVHWRQGSAVRYRHATAQGWTPTASIPVTAELGAEAIEDLLAARIRRHR